MNLPPWDMASRACAAISDGLANGRRGTSEVERVTSLPRVLNAVDDVVVEPDNVTAHLSVPLSEREFK